MLNLRDVVTKLEHNGNTVSIVYDFDHQRWIVMKPSRIGNYEQIPVNDFNVAINIALDYLQEL